MLLGRGGVNADKPDKYDRTPLWCAAGSGHEEVVKMLLGRGDVNPEKPDIYGKTPLLYAAASGHERVVKILLERDDINPDKPSESGETPFWWAVYLKTKIWVSLPRAYVMGKPSPALPLSSRLRFKVFFILL